MNKEQQTNTQPTQQIEKDYINNMLDIMDVSPQESAPATSSPTASEAINNASEASVPESNNAEINEAELNAAEINESNIKEPEKDKRIIVQHEIIDYSDAYKQTEITCKVFNIAGLNIAVPASSIRAVLKQQKILAADNNSQAVTSIGTINHNNEMIDVIDIEHLMMNNENDYENKLANIIIFAGSSTAFICNELLDEQTIPSDQIHWRETNSERLWLAGTAAKMGLVLLDIQGVINTLQNKN